MTDLVIKLLEWILDKISWNKLKQVFRFAFVLEKRRRPAFWFFIFLLVTWISLTGWYFSRSLEYKNIAFSSLEQDSEPTPQRFKGLEAFILSSIEGKLDEDLKNAEFNVKFREECEKLQVQLENFRFGVEAVNFEIAPGENEGLILTDTAKVGFLFLPVFILRPALGKEDLRVLASKDRRDKVKQDSLIAKLTGHDREIKKDVALSKHIAESLQAFTRIAVVNDTEGKVAQHLMLFPAQVYLITKNGVNRIFSNFSRAPSYYYGSQFSPTTFFPSRPYFWPTFQEKKSGNKESIVPREGNPLGNYFHISRPYMDLGGNGLVITLTRGIYCDGVQAVLCFDLPFVGAKSIPQALVERIDTFDGEKLQVEITLYDAGKIVYKPVIEKCCSINNWNSLLQWLLNWLPFIHKEVASNQPSKLQQKLLENMNAFVQSKIERGERAEVFGISGSST